MKAVSSIITFSQKEISKMDKTFRKEFIANHPYPVTDNELLNDEAIPGHSRPAMLRYLKMYRESIANQKEQ